MLSIQQLKDQTQLNVIAAFNYEATCFWLLVKQNNLYYTAHYVIGQMSSILLNGRKDGNGYKRIPSHCNTELYNIY